MVSFQHAGAHQPLGRLMPEENASSALEEDLELP